MSSQKRENTGFLLKQRAFLKLYIITNIENGRWYGMSLRDELRKEFDHLGYRPQHSEVYRALHELLEDGLLKRGEVLMEGSKYQKVALYYIRDTEKVKAYKKLIKVELDRCKGLIEKALADNYS